MTQFERAQWQVEEEKRLQGFLNDMCESLSRRFSMDCACFQVEITVLEPSKHGRFSAYRQLLAITDGNMRLVALELEAIQEVDANEGLIGFLSTVDEDFLPIGTVLKLNRIVLADGLSDSTIAALAHAVTQLLHNTVELVVCEAVEMKRQPTIWQETWITSYGIRNEKWVEYEGIQYLRSDAPNSWHF